jgi:hypothetical protein
LTYVRAVLDLNAWTDLPTNYYSPRIEHTPLDRAAEILVFSNSETSFADIIILLSMKGKRHLRQLVKDSLKQHNKGLPPGHSYWLSTLKATEASKTHINSAIGWAENGEQGHRLAVYLSIFAEALLSSQLEPSLRARTGYGKDFSSILLFLIGLSSRTNTSKASVSPRDSP